ncbi:MAG: type I polyketide synthase, partial [Rhizobacter sp.]
QARDIDAFWKNLRDGRDCIDEIPDSRWDWSRLYGDPRTEGDKTNARRAGLIDGLAEFDPLFFGISPREALGMDPQQRLLMSHVWSAIEDAGYAASSLSGSDTALFVGTASSGYDSLALAAGGIEGSSATGAAPSIGPNRMSYLLDLHGPSEPIETACSSALVAIHKAVQQLRSGQSRLAIAGGINTLVVPAIQVAFSKAGMLCEDGRCKTFSKDANGYVRGEGVGMLVLKRLSDAEADGDRIHGLIRGTAQNHGGRANSLTAPNPRAQAALIKAAFQQAGVAPATVGYIEAHGTGTPLGDPIEIQGLKSAFKELDPELPEGYCGVGSVKTNIGHLELAAGVAGVIKVLLQMRHKTLVKSLHSEELNPYIDLKGSPFYVVQEAQQWQPLKDEHGQDLPRRAGVSSFGFGGVNAHVVLEEYVPQPAQPHVQPEGPVVVVLSARNDERLREQVRQLRSALEHQAEEALHDIAYTLQVGREAMEVRLAVVVASLDQLRHKLDAYLVGKSADELYRGEVKRNKEALTVFSGEELQETVGKWIQHGKLDKLAEAWSKGLVLEWNRLYGQARPRRIALPTYPFARERYWVESPPTSAVPMGMLHPLVQQNTSDLNEQRYSSTFTGEEFFLRDHVVQGRKVLPGVAQLEMARQAVGRATGHTGHIGNIRLERVAFVRPVVVGDEGLHVHIALEAQADGSIGYEIYSVEDDAAVLHGQGRAVLGETAATEVIDVAALRAQCQHSLGGPAVYEAFAQGGLGYGPAFQGLKEVHAGRDDAGLLVIGDIHLPDVTGGQGEFELHPALLDAALQASLGMALGQENSLQQTLLPFALERLEVVGAIPVQAKVVIREVAGSSAAVRKLDVRIVDLQGQVCVRLTSFSSRALPGEQTVQE